ncbi:MAG TPA: hypothetical protein VFW34_04075 [Candidatus Rubrimentiphilum sp.]|nr:hypothetical protein [Candidatus Rubrimentiphilum sp.]
MKYTGQGKHSREEPAQSQPFSLLTQDDHRQRLVMAFAAAVALEMVLAQLIPWRTTTIPPEQPEIITIAKLVRIEHRPTPSPKPIVHVHVIAPANVQPKVVNPGRPSENQHIRRIAAARPIVRTKYHKAIAAVHIPTGGQGASTGKSKAPTGGIGTGGTGTGQSGTGTGTGGAAAASEPCGYVDFIPYDQPTIDNGTGRIWEHISMTVRFPDGTAQSIDLDYPWFYPSSSADPFRITTAKTALFQFPPSGQSEPALVQYVIDHTRPGGTTKLKDCPTG